MKLPIDDFNVVCIVRTEIFIPNSLEVFFNSSKILFKSVISSQKNTCSNLFKLFRCLNLFNYIISFIFINNIVDT